MKYFVLFAVWVCSAMHLTAQNVGIGTATPLTRLHVFSGASGNPSPFSPMVVEGNTNTYFNLLVPNVNESGILFGNAANAASGGIIYNGGGTSNGFQFRTNGNINRMILDMNGNLRIGSGSPSATLDVQRGSAFDGTAVFRGTSNTSHFNYGTDEDTYIRAGKNNRFVVLNDIPGGRVGIGTNIPNAPLGFPAALGKKITLYPGGTGDVGFAVQGNLLQIYADHPNADIAFGYDQAGTFTERFRMRANGALSINSNAGAAGQTLQSNGANAAPFWDYGLTKAFSSNSAAFSPLVNNGDETTITSVTVTVLKSSTVTIYGTVWLHAPGCFGCGDATVFLLMNDPTSSGAEFIIAADPHVINLTTMNFAYSPIFNVPAGTHTFTLRARKVSGPTVSSGIGHDPNYQTRICTLKALVTPI